MNCAIKKESKDLVENIVKNTKLSYNLYERSKKKNSNMNENGELNRLKELYPNVTEPLPLNWSSTEKNNSIGLSNGNLRVHYKGKFCEENYRYFPLFVFPGSF